MPATEPRAGFHAVALDAIETGDKVIHDLRGASGADRPHRLERDCWCEPEAIDQDGSVYVVHHSMQDVLAAHADAPSPS